MRRILLILTATMIAATMMVVASAVAQAEVATASFFIQQDQGKTDQKTDEKADEKAKAEQTGEEKGKEEEKAKEGLPKSGGISGTSVALLATGAIVLLIGGGLVVSRIVR